MKKQKKIKIDSEASFRDEYRKKLKEAGITTEYISVINRNGIPDLFIHGFGLSGWLELKFTDGLPSRLQAGCLDHRISGPQRLFLEDISGQGIIGAVAIGMPMSEIDCESQHGADIGVFLFHISSFDDSGQISKQEFLKCRHFASLSNPHNCVDSILSMANEFKQKNNHKLRQLKLPL